MHKIIWNTLVTLVILLMAGAVLIYIAPHLNWHVDAVVSGSMEPEIMVGSLAITRPIDPDDVKVGDIITFRPFSFGEDRITHRVNSIGRNPSLFFVTKGDANTKADPFTIPAGNLIGKVSFHVPNLGSLTGFLKTPTGFLVGVVIPGVFLTTAYIFAITREIRAYLISRKKTVANEY